MEIKVTADESTELMLLNMCWTCWYCVIAWIRTQKKGAQAFVSRLSNTRAAFLNVCVDFGASGNEV